MLLSITDAVVPSKFSHSSVSRRAILDKTNTRHVLTRDKIFVTLNFIVGRTIIDISRAAVVLLQALGEPVKPLRTVEMRDAASATFKLQVVRLGGKEVNCLGVISDFPALVLSQKPAQASHQKQGHARAMMWLRVAYGLGFQFGKPFTWALDLTQVLRGHGPWQANSHEPAVNFFLTSELAVSHPVIALVLPPVFDNPRTLSFAIGFTMLDWCIKVRFLFFLAFINDVYSSHAQVLSYCKTDCQQCQ